jgi:hypothetical protein
MKKIVAKIDKLRKRVNAAEDKDIIFYCPAVNALYYTTRISFFIVLLLFPLSSSFDFLSIAPMIL